MQKIAIITSGFLPVPATKGGAVENIVENLMIENEKSSENKFHIFSVFDSLAEKQSKKYKNTSFSFIKINLFIKVLDRLIFFIFKNILRKDNSHSYRYIFQRLYFLFKVSFLLKKYKYDKILLENHPTQYLALKWNKNFIKYKNRYFYHCHNKFPGTYGCFEIIKETKTIISVSKFRENSVKELLQINDEKFIVVKNKINEKYIKRQISNSEKNEVYKKYNIDKNQHILMYTGRIVDGKGVKELIKSLEYIKNRDYKLLIVGSSLNALNVKNKYEEDIFKLSNKYKDKIIFTGYIKYCEIYKLYNIADILILPSIMEDSAPLTVVEGIVANIPIITTNSGGIPEYVNKEFSIILDKSDINIEKKIAQAIDKLIENQDLYNLMKKNIKIESKKYTLKQYYKEFINAIK